MAKRQKKIIKRKVKKNINSNKNHIYIKIDQSKRINRKDKSESVAKNKDTNYNQSQPFFYHPQISRPPILEIKSEKHKSPILEKTEIENMILKALNNNRPIEPPLSNIEEPVKNIEEQVKVEDEEPINIEEPIIEKPIKKRKKVQIDEEPQTPPLFEKQIDFYDEYRREFFNEYGRDEMKRLLPKNHFKDVKKFEILRNQIITGEYNPKNPKIRKNRSRK